MNVFDLSTPRTAPSGTTMNAGQIRKTSSAVVHIPDNDLMAHRASTRPSSPSPSPPSPSHLRRRLLRRFRAVLVVAVHPAHCTAGAHSPTGTELASARLARNLSAARSRQARRYARFQSQILVQPNRTHKPPIKRVGEEISETYIVYTPGEMVCLQVLCVHTTHNSKM